MNANQAENIDLDNGLSILIAGNSIQFTTPEGVTYFKNFKNFVKDLLKGQVSFFAPKSAENLQR